MKMLVVNPAGRFTASQLLNDSFLRGVNTRKDGSMGSDMFLSTNESSKIISQTLVAGQKNGILGGRIIGQKPSTVEGWRNFENKVMINLPGQSGEKMELNRGKPDSLPQSSDRLGLMTAGTGQRPSNKGPPPKDNGPMRHTFYSNTNTASHQANTAIFQQF
mmetsp:Transcript_41777/g.63793  ORF Transcript_41777/g.63793 Transcript_41777/m.63793 type:complete len:161 (+) Transcript_41777:3919-4401(+)